MKKKLLIFSLVLVLAFVFTACGESGETRSSMKTTLGDDGSITIERNSREETTPMGDSGWTILVYLCGTDLESDSQMGAMDMEEMEKASTGKDVRFVVQTGGTKKWSNDVDADKCQRYEISNGKTELAEETDLASMGKSDTLSDFVKWGVKNYGAERMGLVLWNHGGGSITGVCFDEKNDNDSLTLREVDAALLSAYDSMTDNFEFIGFDACLMATAESANILASYADYMYASQEMEPGYGWDYKSIGDYLGKNPAADGASLGKVVADSFYESCKDSGEEDMATFSVTDLSKVDELLVEFNDYAKSLYSATEDTSVLSEVAREAVSSDNFGGNNKSEGYTNMVDLEDIVEAGSSYADGTDEAVAAIDDAVIYTKNGSDHKGACGLATYYPLEIQGTTELETFGKIAISPSYLSFVDRAAHSNVEQGYDEDYDDSEATDFWGNYEYSEDSEGNYEDTEDYYEEYAGDESYWEYYDDFEQTGESESIKFKTKPGIDDEGLFGFTLSEEGLENTASVQANVLMVSEDGKDLIELGTSVDIQADWDTGVFKDNFDGYWFSLPDGQNLAVYVVSECDGYDVYTSPVEVNGEETNLRITHDYESDKITIDGMWEGIDDEGMADKNITPLEKGDKIVPLYYATEADDEDGDEFQYSGEEYTFDGTPEIDFEYLSDGDFYYSFFIDDIYGDYYATDYVEFGIEGDEVFYYEDED